MSRFHVSFEWDAREGDQDEQAAAALMTELGEHLTEEGDEAFMHCWTEDEA